MVDYFPRVQEIVLPLLRAEFEGEAAVSSWINDIDYREYPLINVRRIGGFRDLSLPNLMDRPVVEITVIHDKGLVEAEQLYARVLDTLIKAQSKQTVVDRGYISQVKETMGMTQFSSLFQDTFRVQGLVELVIRPNRKEL